MKLNKIFTSHMVFPRNLPIRIYGEGFGEVEILFAGHKKKTVSHENNWMVEFPAMEYGGPYSMTVIFEDNTIVLRDIYIGEVFLFAKILFIPFHPLLEMGRSQRLLPPTGIK